MTNKQLTLIWLRDLMEQLSDSRRQLEWTENPEAIEMLRDKIIRDLNQCKRLAESLPMPSTGSYSEVA